MDIVCSIYCYGLDGDNVLRQGIKLYDHQKVSISLLENEEAFALFHDMGTGKTLTMLYHIARLDIDSCLIVAPKATMGAWERDISLFEGEAKKKLERIVTIVNYDLVWRRDEYNVPWDCLVLDESHYIKNRTSKRSKFLLQLALKTKYRYILTGTPTGNGQLENIWSQYAFLYPSKGYRGTVSSDIFGSYSEFTKRYCILNRFFQPYRYVNVNELQDTIGEYSYRVVKEECLDLPEKLPDVIYDIEQKEKSKYKQMSNDSVIKEFELIADNPLSKMLRLRQICSGFITLDDRSIVELKNEKIKVLGEFLDDFDRKLVIFADFKYSIKQITKLLVKKKIKHVVLDGDQKDKSVWRKFQSDESIRVIVCQYQSANAGIDLYRADTMIFYEPTRSSTILSQAKDRIHRIGQTQKCTYVHFLTKGSIERAIYKALQGYQDFNEKLFEEYMEEYQKGGIK